MYAVHTSTPQAARTAHLALYASEYVAFVAAFVPLRVDLDTYPYTDTVKCVVLMAVAVAMFVTALVLRWTRRNPSAALNSARDVQWVIAGQFVALGVALEAGLTLSAAVVGAFGVCLWAVRRLRKAIAGHR